MHHIAIMKKSWKLTQKILSGKKNIESRWYKTKHSPWNKITSGEKVYFKDSGDPVTIKAEVEKVIQFSELTPEKVNQILEEYGNANGIEKERLNYYHNLFKDKKHCMSIFLKNPQSIAPFHINKHGFGNMAAWITLKDINNIKVKE
jgi:ASC-1-like (ASCH) protein